MLFVYKGVVTALRKTKLIPARESNDGEKKKLNTILLICVSALLVTTLIIVLLIFAGKL